MGLGIPLLQIKILLESNLLKSRILVRISKAALALYHDIAITIIIMIIIRITPITMNIITTITITLVIAITIIIIIITTTYNVIKSCSRSWLRKLSPGGRTPVFEAAENHIYIYIYNVMIYHNMS